MEGMLPNLSFKEKVGRFFKSKIIVIVAIFALFSGAFYVSKEVQADDNDVDISMVYQYYILKNVSGDDGGGILKWLKDKGQEVLNDQSNGILGSGGSTTNVSYSDLVNNSPNKADAKTFVTAMVTLNSYNYLETKTQGIGSTFKNISRGLTGAIVLLPAVLLDLTTQLFATMISLIAKYNVFVFIGNAFVNSGMSSGIADALGLTNKDIKDMVSLGLAVFSIVIVATLVYALRKGSSNVDQSAMSRFKGRLIGFIAIPVAFAFGAMMISEIAGLTNSKAEENKEVMPAYAKYFLDTKSWAYQRNFALSDVNADNAKSKNGSYVDATFNPYKATGGANAGSNRREDIASALWNLSDLKDVGTMKNTALVLAYMRNDVYDSYSYLSYEQSDEAQKNGAVGSIKTFLTSFQDKKNLLDFSEPYSSRATHMPNWSMDNSDSNDSSSSSSSSGDEESSSDDSGESGGSPMANAGEDYVKGNSGKVEDRISAWSTIWTDRYIYGAKQSGNKLKEYYNSAPSPEQVFSGAGGGGGKDFRFSDESMFYILGTKFEENKGVFYLSKPTKGAYNTVPTYDSQRPSYYSISMVGSPLLTIPALLATPILQLVILIASVVGILSIGFLDMNLKPLRAWGKAITMGDIEYTLASIYYAIGIVATIIIFTIMPQFVIDILTKMFATVGSLLTGKGSDGLIGSQMVGLSNWGTFILALTVLFLYFKNQTFRQRLTELLMMPWIWASEKGQKLEDSIASPEAKSGLQKTRSTLQARRERNTEFTRNMMNGNTGLQRYLNGIDEKERAGEDDSFADKMVKGREGGVRDNMSKFIGKGAKPLAKGISRLGAADLARRARIGEFGDATGDGLHNARQNNLATVRNMGTAQRMKDALRETVNADDKQLYNKLYEANKIGDVDKLYDENNPEYFNTEDQHLTDADKAQRQALNEDVQKANQAQAEINAEEQQNKVLVDALTKQGQRVDDSLEHQNVQEQNANEYQRSLDTVDFRNPNDANRVEKALDYEQDKLDQRKAENSLEHERIQAQMNDLQGKALSEDAEGNYRKRLVRLENTLGNDGQGLTDEQIKSFEENQDTVNRLENRQLDATQQKALDNAHVQAEQLAMDSGLNQNELDSLHTNKHIMDSLGDPTQLSGEDKATYDQAQKTYNALATKSNLSSDKLSQLDEAQSTINTLGNQKLSTEEQAQLSKAKDELASLKRQAGLNDSEFDKLASVQSRLTNSDMAKDLQSDQLANDKLRQMQSKQQSGLTARRQSVQNGDVQGYQTQVRKEKTDLSDIQRNIVKSKEQVNAQKNAINSKKRQMQDIQGNLQKRKGELETYKKQVAQNKERYASEFTKRANERNEHLDEITRSQVGAVKQATRNVYAQADKFQQNANKGNEGQMARDLAKSSAQLDGLLDKINIKAEDIGINNENIQKHGFKSMGQDIVNNTPVSELTREFNVDGVEGTRDTINEKIKVQAPDKEPRNRFTTQRPDWMK